MEAKAHLKYVRIAPRKVKIVLDLIRGKDTDTAMAILKNTPKAASPYLIKLLKSAIANAEHNFNMDASNLYVSECFVCPGPTLKRVMPRAHGRAFSILKRTSHVTLAVKEKNEKLEAKDPTIKEQFYDILKKGEETTKEVTTEAPLETEAVEETTP